MLYHTSLPIYKRGDYRCLAPHSHLDPSMWGFYHHKRFKAAVDGKAMQKVPVIKHDKEFNNWIDLKVHKKLTKKKKSVVAAWKRIYGSEVVQNVKLRWSKKGNPESRSKKCRKKCDKLVIVHLIYCFDLLFYRQKVNLQKDVRNRIESSNAA